MKMTKPKIPEPTDPKKIFIEVFKKTGGLDGMVTWSRTHRTLFYSLFGKMINQPVVQVDLNNNVKVDEVQLRASLEHAFHRLIEAQKASVGDPAAYVNNERVIDHEPQSAAPSSPAAEQPSAAPDSIAANAVPLRSVARSSGPSVPGLYAGVALDAADDGLSTTEKFLRWDGHGREKP
jgi:hypothetical protein